MKIAELFEEDILKDLEGILSLRSTASHVSHEQAENAYKWLTSQGYRWTFHESHNVRYARIVAASYEKASWRNAPGLRERRNIREMLKTFGFKHSGSPPEFTEAGPIIWYSPHVYFW
ncbi:MAG: hypothetical protein DDT31_00014 [Syntrophomonadaceae bacterium]|nr:hypothetical protein [Bacillota bacterium]